MKKFFILLFVALTAQLSAQAYPLIHIKDVDISNYPNVKIKIFDIDSAGKISETLNKANFKVYDNGNPVTINTLICSPSNPLKESSVLLSYDLAMDTSNGEKSNFALSKFFAKKFFGLIASSKFEASINSFDENCYQNIEFTSDTSKLIQTVDSLGYRAGSNLDTSFTFDPTGSIQLMSVAKFSRSLIVLTDGAGKVNAQRIIDLAKNSNIRIFIVSMGKELSQEVKQIALSTGGRWYEDVSDSAKVLNVSAGIFYNSFNFQGCELSWNNILDCIDNHTILVLNDKSKSSSEFSVDVPDELKQQLFANPPFLKFGPVMPGKTKTLDLNLSVKKGTCTITGLNIQNPYFTIVTGKITSPVTLSTGQNHHIQIMFTPLDSALEFASLAITSNACSGNTVLITGGFPNAQPKTATLKILEPRAKQVFIIGDTASVIWTGLLPTDVVQLEYSTDNGNKWDTLAKNVTSLKYDWTVPDEPSDSCKIRVIQLWPNNIGKTLDLRHQNGVNSANFNSDGSLVITACKDSVARIWNGNNSKLVYELRSHTKSVVWSVFDKNDKFALTSSEDSTAILWDIEKGTYMGTFKGAHNGFVRSANFNPDGTSIVTAGADGSCFVWDITTFKVKDTVLFNNGSFWYSAYSPNGKFISVGTSNGRIVVWNTETKKIEKTFNTFTNAVVSHFSFTPDSKKLAAATWLGKAIAWNFETGDTLFSVEHKDTTQNIVALTSANFNYTGDLLLTSGNNEARLWNGNNGAFIGPPFTEHGSGVQSAIFNFDGTRVLTASWDSTAKIWNLLERALQTGYSDSLFSIASADINISNIDFKPVALGSIKDSTIRGFIVNKSPFPVKIYDFNITGNNANEFTIIRGDAPLIIDSMSKAQITMRFKPKAIGKRTAKMTIVYSGNKKEIDITGDCYDPVLEMFISKMDFGKIEIGDFRDTTFAIFKNRSGNPVKINKISNSGPDIIHFRILQGADSLILNPGQTHNLKLRFIPEAVSKRNAVISIDFLAQGSPQKLLIYGEGVAPRIDTVTISIPTVSGAPDDIIEIPVTLKNISLNGINSTISALMSNLTFNSTLLEPIEFSGKSDLRMTERKLELIMPLTSVQSDTQIIKIKFRVGLGNDSVTPLRLSNSSSEGKGRLVIFEESGKFILNGYCTEGGVRLFESENAFGFEPVKPNPVINSAKIEFETFEKGEHSLYLININGEIVKDIFRSQLATGRHHLDLNCSDLAPGAYFIILETPTKKISRQLEIIR